MPENPVHSLGRERPDRWPFFRDRPDRVVLGPRPGQAPSDLPPVRIFLGTEEAQYRAERIFFYSIEQVRDPARTYEIYLMKNVSGFDRSRWRTGFTNYRYAIPEWAGGEGRAIYNDVDQIYLADPALLFDLEMGNHGYLAISAKDTSVMLIDCGRMIDLWNVKTAATLGKHALIDKPSSTPGLWGELDGHWNARDQEYVEGRTKCLHYTALHQQPWQPSPEVYSYHPNPLAYVWHDLERGADAEGYEVFRSDRPSLEFASCLAAAAGREPTPPPAIGPLTTALAKELGIQSVLELRLADGRPAAAIPAERERRELVLTTETAWPAHEADAVVASGILDAVPPADLPWLLGRLFTAAGRLVHLDVTATAPDGLGSAEWWRQRVAEINRRHPGKSWSLTVPDQTAPIPGTIRYFSSRSRDLPSGKAAWVLLEDEPTRDEGARTLAKALADELGLTADERNWRHVRPNGGDEGWPGVVIAAGRKTAHIALDIKRRSRGVTKVVQLGRCGMPLERFDLVVADPAERLPIRPNTAQVTAPLVPANDHGDAAGDRHVLVIGPTQRPFRRTADDLARLSREVAQHAPGVKLVCFLDGVTDEDRETVLQAAGEVEVLEGDSALATAIDRADRLYTTGENPHVLARLCDSGRPVTLLELPHWYDGVPASKPVRNALTLLIGGGTSYRGTPHQQHALARLVDRLIARGWLELPHEPTRLHRALIARGLLHKLDESEPMASPHPLDDRARVVAAVREILTREAAAA
jgi:hypothetical protein